MSLRAVSCCNKRLRHTLAGRARLQQESNRRRWPLGEEILSSQAKSTMRYVMPMRFACRSRCTAQSKSHDLEFTPQRDVEPIDGSFPDIRNVESTVDSVR
eukprot:1133330-Pleurochrysis_carterae.AAC.3